MTASPPYYLALRAALCAALLATGAVCAAPTEQYQIIATYPHDPHAWIEGLATNGHILVESDGLKGQSHITITPLRDSSVIDSRSLPPTEYGEGITFAGSLLVQLTYRQQRGTVYTDQLAVLSHFAYVGQGWGITYDGTRLIMSNGIAQLQEFKAGSLALSPATLTVHDGAQPISQLNELEYGGGWLYANIWHQDRIAVIDPATGAVHAWLDLAALRAALPPSRADVLNGIAYDPLTGHLFVTGKFWPLMFELALGSNTTR